MPDIEQIMTEYNDRDYRLWQERRRLSARGLPHIARACKWPAGALETCLALEAAIPEYSFQWRGLNPPYCRQEGVYAMWTKSKGGREPYILIESPEDPVAVCEQLAEDMAKMNRGLGY